MSACTILLKNLLLRIRFPVDTKERERDVIIYFPAPGNLLPKAGLRDAKPICTEILNFAANSVARTIKATTLCRVPLPARTPATTFLTPSLLSYLWQLTSRHDNVAMVQLENKQHKSYVKIFFPFANFSPVHLLAVLRLCLCVKEPDWK